MCEVDAVITWVDGNDPLHKEKRDKYINTEKIGVEKIGLYGTRFNQVEEVKYCIYSIRKYAKWIRNIYLVTDNQIPEWLTDTAIKELGIKLIDHKLIFKGYSELLPTFNSRSIESLLWRIPDLSNNYIYFNDDFFIIDEVGPEDFFYRDKIIYRGTWKKNWSGFLYSLYKYLATLLANRNFDRGSTIKKAALMSGFRKKYFYPAHAPYPMKKNMQLEYYKNNPNTLYNNVKYKFRNVNQYVSIALFTHIAFKKGIGINMGIDDVEYISLLNDSFKSIKHKVVNLEKKKKKFLCIQNMDQAGPEELIFLRNYLENHI